MRFEPKDLFIWLAMIDVNCLNAPDADNLAALDIEDDGDLERIVGDWMKSQYDRNNDQNRTEMREILEQSKQWTAKQLRPVFVGIGLPSEQDIKDIDRFMNALRRHILA